MNWVKSEYILKGVYLGLVLFAGLQHLGWEQIGTVALFMAGGLAVALAAGAARVAARLRGVAKSPVGFLLYVILESPGLIYAGLILGLAAGTFFALPDLSDGAGKLSEEQGKDLAYCLLGGAVLGYGLGELRAAPLKGLYKFVLAIAVAGGAMAGVWYWLQESGLLAADPARQQMLGYHLLLGLPFFYLLTFAGVAEESEVETAALCAVLGLGLYYANPLPTAPGVGFILPVGLYCLYTIRVLRPLRVFKHTLRGYSHAQVGRVRQALESFNRALQLDRKNALAKQGLLRLHRTVDPGKLDPETLGLMNPNLSLAHAANLLVGGNTPTPDHIDEARKLLNMVDRGWPAARARIDYYRVVADTHARQFDDAVDRLNRLLDPEPWDPADRWRAGTLFDAWQLALRTHPTLKARAGDPQLGMPGRRVEAVLAAQRQAELVPDDPAVADLRDELLEDLTEVEYEAAGGGHVLADFPYALAEGRGNVLLKEPGRFERGAMFLRVAAHGQPARAPGIFQTLVDASAARGDVEDAKRYRVLIREAGRHVGPENLAADQQAIYFAAVKQLSEEAAAAGDYKEAIFDLSLYTRSEASGKPTLKTLAGYYEKDGQVMEALRVTEKALLYGEDAELLAKKDSFYYSVEPDVLREKATDVRPYFDVKYCVRKAKALLDGKNQDLELLDWAFHLTQLALVLEPKNVVALVQMARCRLRRGERDEGLRILEDVRETTPSGNDERDAWYFALKQLAMIYIDEVNRPDLGIICLREYQQSEKSGADTIYHLGRAYEAQGDVSAALRCYEAVKGYESHPLRFDAEDAVRRLKSPAEAS